MQHSLGTESPNYEYCFPVGNTIPVKLEVVITTGKVGQADITPSFRVERKWRPPYELKGKILELISVIYLTVTIGTGYRSVKMEPEKSYRSVSYNSATYQIWFR